MTIDRETAEHRRFARLLGTDGDRGSGLPVVGTDSETADREDTEQQTNDQNDRDRDDGIATRRTC